MIDEEINRKLDVVADHLAHLAVSQEKSEARVDRLERVLKLAIRLGLRERQEAREKINALLDAQIKNEERFAALADAQTHAERKLDALIDIVREGREGKNGDGRGE